MKANDIKVGQNYKLNEKHVKEMGGFNLNKALAGTNYIITVIEKKTNDSYPVFGFYVMGQKYYLTEDSFCCWVPYIGEKAFFWHSGQTPIILEFAGFVQRQSGNCFRAWADNKKERVIFYDNCCSLTTKSKYGKPILDLSHRIYKLENDSKLKEINIALADILIRLEKLEKNNIRNCADKAIKDLIANWNNEDEDEVDVNSINNFIEKD